MIVSAYRKPWCLSAQKIIFILNFFLEILKRFANLLCWVIWTWLFMPTKSDSINLHERSLSFIFMKNIKLIPSLFLEILQPTYLTSFFRLKSPAIISSNTIFYFRKCKIIFSKFCHFWVKQNFTRNFILMSCKNLKVSHYQIIASLWNFLLHENFS